MAATEQEPGSDGAAGLTEIEADRRRSRAAGGPTGDRGLRDGPPWASRHQADHGADSIGELPFEVHGHAAPPADQTAILTRTRHGSADRPALPDVAGHSAVISGRRLGCWRRRAVGWTPGAGQRLGGACRPHRRCACRSRRTSAKPDACATLSAMKGTMLPSGKRMPAWDRMENTLTGLWRFANGRRLCKPASG